MWKLAPNDEFEKRLSKWPKKYHRELAAMLANLDTVLVALKKGAKAANIKFGFIHPEPAGVWAIDQKGGGQGLTQTRLYTYGHESQEILHVITMGDKSTQKEDIAYAKAFAEGVKGSESEA